MHDIVLGIGYLVHRLGTYLLYCPEHFGDCFVAITKLSTLFSTQHNATKVPFLDGTLHSAGMVTAVEMPLLYSDMSICYNLLIVRDEMAVYSN